MPSSHARPQVQAVEVPVADRLLNALVSLLWRPDASMADNIPGQPPGAGGERLEGKLSLTRALVQVTPPPVACTLCAAAAGIAPLP